MRQTSSAVLLLAVAAGFAVFACSSSTSTNACGSGTPPSVIGTYALISYTTTAGTVTTADGASGQLRFYSGVYGFNVTIPMSATIVDSGNYSITGSKCMSQASVSGNGSTTGTFTLSGTTPGSVLTFSGTNSLVGPVGFAGSKQ